MYNLEKNGTLAFTCYEDCTCICIHVASSPNVQTVVKSVACTFPTSLVAARGICQSLHTAWSGRLLTVIATQP